MSTPTPPHDAQRELEQRALRNVRGLVDKMDALEKVDSRSQKRLLAGIIVGAIVVVGLIVAAVVNLSGRHASSKTIVIDTAKLPPVKGGPPK